MDLRRSLSCLSTSILGILLTTISTQAQVVTDSSVNTIVASPNNRDFNITGGGIAGNNLFHSFSDFSVPTGGSAIFDNATDVQNIFSRVTGSTSSNIDGLIQANGTANLFLLNPNGLLFGPNAQLNIGGSFLGTTASHIKFSDGVKFSATNPTPLLTMSVPIGLQFGRNPGAITSQGANLETATNQAFLLLGGNINQIGGTIKSNGGRIEIGSVQQPGTVSLAPDWTIGYDNIQTYGDIRFSQSAILRADGEGGGAMQFQGRQISVREYSTISSRSRGAINAGNVKFHATDRLEVSDVSANGSDYSTLRIGVRDEATGNGGNLEIVAPEVVVDGGFISTQTSGIGNAGNLTLKTQRLSVDNSGQISATTFGSGNGGTVNITAASVDLRGYLPSYEDDGFFIFSSGIFVDAERGSSGNGGTLNLTADRLRVADGGRVSSSAYASATGNAGNTFIQVNNLLVDGVIPNEVGDLSGIKAGVQPGANGNGGILDIRANIVRVINGGQISVANEGTGQAGNMTINTRSLDVSGVSSDGTIPSRIAATANSSLPAGSIGITADTVSLRDRAIIAVSSLGSGDAGNLSITANRLKLDASSLESEVKGGSQGNIDLTVNDAITLRNNSSVSTNAASTANGGNIKINTPILLGTGNSDIVANATKGAGGNINITTQGIFGLKPRPQITPENDITAASEFGLNGSVEVNNIGVDPNSGLVTLPTNPIDSSQQIATGCSRNRGASFVITGRGGVPRNPIQNLNTDRPWQDARNSPNLASTNPPAALIEATNWQLSPQGQPQLIAGKPIGLNPTSITCAQ